MTQTTLNHTQANQVDAKSTLVTPEFRMDYLCAFRETNRYLIAIFPKTLDQTGQLAHIRALEAAHHAEMQAKGIQANRVRPMFEDGDGPRIMPNGTTEERPEHHRGSWLMKIKVPATRSQRPFELPILKVVDGATQPAEKGDFYSGAYGQAIFSAYHVTDMTGDDGKPVPPFLNTSCQYLLKTRDGERLTDGPTVIDENDAAAAFGIAPTQQGAAVNSFMAPQGNPNAAPAQQQPAAQGAVDPSAYFNPQQG